MKNIILASASPRRFELLKMIGITDFTVTPAHIDETPPEGKSPEETVCLLAMQKAEAVAVMVASDCGQSQTTQPNSPLIIAADTLVYIDGRLLGKPIDTDDAAETLRTLSGRCHTVYTGIAITNGGKSISKAEKTDVYFREISDDEIAEYIATGEPMDKAGAYGAQGYGAVFIERIDGDFFNVVGLPLCRLSKMLKEFL